MTEQEWWSLDLSVSLRRPSVGALLRSACFVFFFFSSRRRHTRCSRDWSSDVCSSDLTPERRRAESEAAAQTLGVRRRITLPLPNRYLMDTVENRVAVAEVIREVRPEILFIPYGVDAHPDHLAAERPGEAARFSAQLAKTQMRGGPPYPGRNLPFFCTPF